MAAALQANDLILFARIVDAGSFTRASELTGYPKATLSRRLARLEDTFGERLIQRSTRRMTLTEFGERMLEHARRLGEETEEAAALALNRQSEPKGTLRVSLPPGYRQLPVAELVARFAERYPDVRLELDLSARRVDLVAERFDVAVRAAAHLPDDSTLVARCITTQQAGLYASRYYLERHGTPDTPAALLDHFGLVLTVRGAPQPWHLSRGSEQWNGFPRSVLAANSLGLLQDLAARGLGIVELSHRYARAGMEQRQLQHVLPDWRTPDVSIWCVTAGRRLLPKRTQAFIETLREVLVDGADRR
ncbi:MAG: LysR family transcriptional regulator [Proteobacteria bacterium]|nr:LysR family transcriptional regulator [Pseudomonadota bacterium]